MGTLEDTKPSLLNRIEEGVDVIDISGKKVGKVKHIQFPTSPFSTELVEFPYDLSKTAIPSEIVYRLLRTGFISVNAGWLARDRIVTLDQIDHVTPDAAHLKVRDENLITA